MSYVVTLADLLPPRRTDHVWTQVRIQESATRGGTYSTLETQTLSPVDTDPENPRRRTLTTELAQQEAGWYRVVWLDATGDASPASEPVSMPGPWVPTADELAALLRTRLREAGDAQVDTFTDSTNPTVTQVEAHIAQETSLVMIDVGDLSSAKLICSTADDIRDAVRSLIAKRVAAIIELSYWTEEVVTTQTAEDFWRYIVEVDQPRVVQAARECRLGDVVPGDESESLKPAGGFYGPRVGDIAQPVAPGAENPLGPRPRW